MSNRLGVSVVLATYNGASFVRQQLESLALQTRRPAELMVCDDGSSDDTRTIIEQFALNSPFPVRLHRNPERLGYADSFLNGASLCSGSLIAFCDQDDVWERDKLERCARAFEDSDVMLAIHSAEAVNADLKPLGYRWPDLRKGGVFKPLSLDPFLHPFGFAMVFSTSLLQRLDWKRRPMSFIPPSDRIMAHDQWIFFCAHVLGKVALISESLVKYRQHSGNTCGALPPSGANSLGLAKATGEAEYANRSDLCRHYSDYLESLAGDSSPELTDRLRAGAKYYSRLSLRFASRAGLHKAAAPRSHKLGSLARLCATGGYVNRGKGGLGWRALIKDVIQVVLPGSFLYAKHDRISYPSLAGRKP